ncbi:hypothetical protein DES53_101560 [Roseimicrobium gellanilyticum]|uniref:Uncharacterized protein n=1 Tax=Roseimicrobium gellanilyticum TaxID=748857 RepID=A0A366HU00_9BACT|nr:hypothetical protein [Roseimicrobium gellanilyticum]RBP47761.1 hypothetical protein DES53_101560 [Roseimicrobium gellanilyticum]
MKPTLRSLLTIAALTVTATLTHAADTALPSSLLADKAPAEAVSVKKARESAKPGEAIVLRGKVGGRKIALVPKAAIAVLADEKSITSCNDMPGDSCAFPWDYCCETPEKIAASTATIQVRDEKGKVVKAPLRGLGDLKELSVVVISGTVDTASTKDNLIVNATSIFVEKP